MNKRKYEQEGYLVGLHSLRFIAFLFIFLFHASGLSILNAFRLKFFFLLSGFVLVNALPNGQVGSAAFRTAESFILKRLARIGPVYYIVILFSFFLLPALASYFLQSSPSLPQRSWTYFLLLSNYDDSDHIYLLKFL
ncbi:MAG: hypothetical protein ACKO6Q_05880 [Bacteroidota bacterium]